MQKGQLYILHEITLYKPGCPHIQIQPIELRNLKIPLLEREAGRGDGDKQTKNHQQKARKKVELEITPKGTE